ncbi:unnamed protein product [Darwinula stevensoni]|uniref:Peptidase S1 domain-containing protein n=1 Tax=Darwinula stevensoni TaxID=69355 RepID=A0A7R9A6V1_9CRUS|nr:unnamed protein product [Darwinula stevensoni]CAG0890443.1 unnamed protein product [Darwinula stevensoni]
MEQKVQDNSTTTCSTYYDTSDYISSSLELQKIRSITTAISWFRRFLEVFLLRRREAEPVERRGELIVGGTPATIAEAPWLVYVQFITTAGSGVCTGSIIDELHVLTAAHCLQKGSDLASYVVVTVGNADATLGTTYTASSWLPNPSYNATAFVNDIAVITLRQPLTFSPSVQPICIPSSEHVNDTQACAGKMFGWGLTSQNPDTRTMILQKLDATVFPNKDCPYWNQNMYICAQGLSTGHGGCFGDSGGPLVVYEDGIAYAIAALHGPSTDLKHSERPYQRSRSRPLRPSAESPYPPPKPRADQRT